jgi:phosphopantothenoylcysteine decarboxylase/phosphopantothenate--cysteine ligase
MKGVTKIPSGRGTVRARRPAAGASGSVVESIAGSIAGLLQGRRVVLGITGGIAAYKAAELCRLLVKAGAEVRVVMTEAATRFVAPLTFQALSGAPVGLDLFDPAAESSEIGHIRLADRAELVVIAPATADAIARMAAGMANDLLSAVVLATRAPVLLAPAMNVNMWEHPLTQANLARLLESTGFRQVSTVGPDRGPLACGWIGAGRLIEPAEIFEAALALLATSGAPRTDLVAAGDLSGRRVVVTAGPTREPIDDVRFIGNRSSGKMGVAIAEAAAARGAQVTLLAGPDTPETGPGLRRLPFETAAELERALGAAAAAADVVVMAAAVADFRPQARHAGKLSRRQGEVTLALDPVPDLLQAIARARRGARPYLVGFAAETAGGDALAARALAKLRDKGCDAIVANDVSAPGIGFGADDNQVTVLFADGARVEIARAAKRKVADRMWDLLAARLEDAKVEQHAGG